MPNRVFVIDAEGTPLLPTCSARARLLLKCDKADVDCVIPFTIRLRCVVDSPVGSFGVGIDDGSKYVGVAIVNDLTNKAVFVGEIKLRQDVKRLVKQRAQYRRTRRSRKLRHRQPRSDNRTRCKLSPSIRTRKESTIRFVKDMQKRINITHATIEEVSFNHAKHKWGKQFSLVETGKTFLREQLRSLHLNIEVVKGWETAEWRKMTNTPKTHGNDAAVILGKSKKVNIPTRQFVIIPRRNRVWMNNPSKKHTERFGFKHYDIIRAVLATRVVIGCVKSLRKKRLNLRTMKDSALGVSYFKSTLIWRPDGLVYLPIIS